MVIDVPMEIVCDMLGHDGSSILWPDLPEPLCRRGFHIEELQYVALSYESILVPYLPAFEYSPNGQGKPVEINLTRLFNEQLGRCNGILFGHSRGQQNGHAIAWQAKERRCYDPGGYITNLDNFVIESFYAHYRTGK